MGLLGASLGLILAVVVGILAVGQVDALRDVGAPLTTGGMRELVDRTWLLMSILVIVVAVAGIAAAARWTLQGR